MQGRPPTRSRIVRGGGWAGLVSCIWVEGWLGASCIRVGGWEVLPSFAMVETRDLSVKLRAFLKAYPWRRIDPVPVTTLEKPLSECTIALVTSAGFVVPGQEPFSRSVRGGDYSFRVIPHDADLQSLEDHHRSDSYSHDGVDADRNMGLPLDRLRELAQMGEIGRVAPRHISVMGSITAPGRFVKRTLPEIADLLVEDHVDIALMVPV